jgi:hypothetical protein
MDSGLMECLTVAVDAILFAHHPPPPMVQIESNRLNLDDGTVPFLHSYLFSPAPLWHVSVPLPSPFCLPFSRARNFKL